MTRPERPAPRDPRQPRRVSVDELLTPDQVANLLQVKKQWLYDQVQRQALPHVRLGKQLRFKSRDIQMFIDRRYSP